jgi:disulfide bond formation protein DsbB
MIDSLKALIPLIVLVGMVIFVITLFLFLFERNRKNFIYDFIADNSLLFAFIVALAAVCGSLFYSNIVGYTPCELCWFQRIFIYPQVVLLGVALWKHDRGIWIYSIWLGAIAACISAFHVYAQHFNQGALPCPIVGQTSTCGKLFVDVYGFITIPSMALTASLMIILFMVMYRIRQKKSAMGSIS